jgi:hypothetical protein
VAVKACQELATQCRQVAEIPARKLKRDREKKDLAGRTHGRILAEFHQKRRKGAGENFPKKFLILQ